MESMAGDRDMFMVSSPTGTCYLANRFTGKIKWCAETNRQFIYIACKGDDVTNYIDLRPQHPDQIRWSDNDQYMYHFKNGVLGQIVPVDSKDEAQKFMDAIYQDSYTKVEVKSKKYYVDHTSGMACAEGPSAFIIERSDFYLHRDSPSWSVRCSQLKASFPDYTKSAIRGPCTVLHARDAVKFLQACREYSLMPQRDVSPLNDFVHNNNLYGINKKIECSETDSSDSLIVNGFYDKEDALIEKVRIGDANCTELKKILRKTCFHENVISYLGWEKDSEYDYYAFEVGGDTLENHLKRHPYKEMDESSLKIIEGLVHGVKHLHDRGLVHLNINPGNVLVKDSTTVKICGTSHCKRIADEPDGTLKDLQDVAHVILYIVSKRKYLRNNVGAGLVDENALTTLVGTANFEVKDILMKVGIVQSAQPIMYQITSLEALLLEPFFWDAPKRLDFFEALSNHFTGKNFSPALQAAVELVIYDVGDPNVLVQVNQTQKPSWQSKFTRLNAHLPNIKRRVPKAGRTYTDGLIITLIKMIRDGRNHFEETKSESVTNQDNQLRIDFTVKGEELGTNDTEMEQKFRVKFPKLLPKLHDAARGHSVDILKKYYRVC